MFRLADHGFIKCLVRYTNLALVADDALEVRYLACVLENAGLFAVQVFHLTYLQRLTNFILSRILLFYFYLIISDL